MGCEFPRIVPWDRAAIPGLAALPLISDDFTDEQIGLERQRPRDPSLSGSRVFSPQGERSKEVTRIRKYRMRGRYPAWGFPGRGNCTSKCPEAGVWLDERGEREGGAAEGGGGQPGPGLPKL